MKRNEVKLEVVYDGEAVEEVTNAESKLYYAVNTSTPVFKFENTYYACEKAIWFVSPSPQGEWVVATQIPKVIYSLPANHPHYNVTFVKIYETTEIYVETGYTSGYHVSHYYNGVLLFGLGYWLGYHHHHHHCHHIHYYGYGWVLIMTPITGSTIAKLGFMDLMGCWQNSHLQPKNWNIQLRCLQIWSQRKRDARSAYNPYNDRYSSCWSKYPYGSWSKGAVADGKDWIKEATSQIIKNLLPASKILRGQELLRVKTKLLETRLILLRTRMVIFLLVKMAIFTRKNDQWLKHENGSWSFSKNPKIKLALK